jgi:hypothetical protein
MLLTIVLNPAIVQMMVCLDKMGGVKELDTEIISEALTNAVSQVEGTHMGQGSQARRYTRPGTRMMGLPVGPVQAWQRRCVPVVVDGW